MPHVLILFVAHLPRATLLSPLLLLAVAVVVLRVVSVGFHGTSRAPPGLLGAPTACVVVSVPAVATLVLLLPVHIPSFLVGLICVCLMLLLPLLSIIKLIAFILPVLTDPLPLLCGVLRVLLILVSTGAIHVVLVRPLVSGLLSVVVHAFLPV